ncbi:MAG: T9SS type A sorting domain-containing protein [Balneolaceae bacterium]
MKKFLLLLTLLVIPASFSFAQEQVREAYFHELRGMEDSAGVSHLFYRLYVAKVNQFHCDGEVQTFYSTTNHIYHLTSTPSDSLKFFSYSGESCTGNDSRFIVDYSFYENDSKKWVLTISFGDAVGVNDFLGHSIGFHIPIVVKQRQQNSNQEYFPQHFYLSPNGDSLYLDSYGTTIPFSGKGEEWPVFDTYDEFLDYADSTSFDWEILGIHPDIDSLYFARSPSHLYRSENYTEDFNLADSSGTHTKLAFDADSSAIYSLITQKQENEYIRNLLISDNFGIYGSWSQLTLPTTDSRFEFIQTDSRQAGHVFVADSNTVYSSFNFGDTFLESFTSDVDLITGLYKKSDSEILYVLTKEKLLEVNTETQETTTLKQIPVSSEPEPKEIPKQITLEQNYPNPFNPSTVIRYQLAVNSLVRLEVFDVTGRKVATLVNGEAKPAGSHQVKLDASRLSSGIYFYRLESSGQTFTQKMMLVK